MNFLRSGTKALCFKLTASHSSIQSVSLCADFMLEIKCRSIKTPCSGYLQSVYIRMHFYKRAFFEKKKLKHDFRIGLRYEKQGM